MSILVLTCAERTLQANLEILNKYGPFTGAAELRADRLLPEELPLLEKFPAMTPLPVILTIRRKADGGAWSGTEEERVRLLRENLSRKIEARKGFAFTDVEEDIFLPVEEAAFRKAGGRIIRSLYSFAGLPENLLQRIGEGRKHPADIPKAAVKITSVRDLSRLFDISLDLRGDFILIGMGETGIPFGILSGRLGCFLNFFSPEEKETAPGHFDPKTLEEVYRFSSINRDTRVFGIIGSPVLHTKSPLIHNAGLKALGMNAVYVPFPLPDTPEDLSGFLALARRIGVEALSVTIPFKEKILPLLAASGAEVRAAGACNTVSIGPGGWEGNNFDIQGFLVPLRRALGRKISGLMCTVLG
ncbi:MAG: type I 3-dehydroquinate dehydratase, partial [Spirochaetales bacterium]